jgi:hypothetical protein
MRRRLLALMAGAKKCEASVDRHRENRQPIPGADKSIDAGTQEINRKPNRGWTRIDPDKMGVVGRVAPCAPSFEAMCAAGRGLPALLGVFICG